MRDADEFLELDLADRALPQAEAPVPGVTVGTVIADFYLPYRCCGGGLPIEVFPPAPPEEPTEPLTASVSQVGCTRNMRSLLIGEVEFTAAGGTPPYFLEDENGNREPLPVEPRDIVGGFAGHVTDSGTGRVKVSLSLRGVVTIHLVGSPVCTEDNQRFSQDFEVTGGQPPYTFVQPDGSQESLDQGAVGTVRGIASGSERSFTLIVADDSEAKCGAQLAIEPYNCTVDEPDCGLPCDGVATRASYPLWLQRPADSMEYRNVRLEIKTLELRDGDNRYAVEPVRLARLNQSIDRSLTSINRQLTSDNFLRIHEAVIGAIGRIIAEPINAAVALPRGEAALQISGDNNEGFSRFSIERFTCHDFTFEIEVNYAEATENRDRQIPRSRTVTYENDRVVFTSIMAEEGDGESRATTFSFDRYRIDRCAAEASPKAQCDQPFPAVGIDVEGSGMGRMLSATEVPDGVSFLWDVTYAFPQLSDKESVGVGIWGNDLSATVDLLVVDEETGCFSTARTRINT